MALSAGVVGVTLWRVPFTDLRAAFGNLDRGSLFLAFFCILALMVLRAYKWHYMMSAVGNFRIQPSLRTLLGGCVLGLITPGRVGELGRCIFVRKLERAQVGILTLLDRALDFWALVTLVGASLFLLVPSRRPSLGWRYGLPWFRGCSVSPASWPISPKGCRNCAIFTDPWQK